MILLALVDHRYRFRYINVGVPGHCHDWHVFVVLHLSKAMDGPLFETPLSTTGSTAVPPVILCDQASPLAPNVKLYGNRGAISEAEKCFNYHSSAARRIAENTFGKLKTRFQFTAKRMECHVNATELPTT